MVGDHDRKGMTMGDRAQIAIKMEDTSKVYLYSHWCGAWVYDSLQTALKRGERWDDPEYLARIIFQEMIGTDQRATGFGIGTEAHGDIGYPIPVLDCDKQTIAWEPAGYYGEEKYRDCTFAEFAEHGPQPLIAVAPGVQPGQN